MEIKMKDENEKRKIKNLTKILYSNLVILLPTAHMQQLLFNKHIKLIKRCLNELPSDYAVFQTTKPTVLYFLLSSLDLLNQLDNFLDKELRHKMIGWIYSLQLSSKDKDCALQKCGFRGFFIEQNICGEMACQYESAHLAQTYTSLCTLLILGDDLTRVDREGVLYAVKSSQCEDGSFCGTGDKQSENDMRFVFCACAICYILNDFSYIDLELLCSFINKSVNYDGGIGQGPGTESHGGSTFCAIASLALIGRLWNGLVLTSLQIERLKQWALMKQKEGFHGRTGKQDDTCYAFWVGATLSILNAQSLVNWTSLRLFILRMQDSVFGGFCKNEDSSNSDILHTYFSLSAMSMFGEPLISPIFPALNISIRAHEHLLRLNSRRSCVV